MTYLFVYLTCAIILGALAVAALVWYGVTYQNGGRL
jgi:nitrogen fixation-related uncharacterized protein